MVPVKKPGRPLSACPHISHELCGCSSITAAIPRNQQCGCGTQVGTPLPQVQPKPMASTIQEASSPTKPSFKIHKTSKSNSRRQSYDLNNLEKMDPNNVNVVPFQSQKVPQMIAPAITNGYGVHLVHTTYTNGPPVPPFVTSIDISNGQEQQHTFPPTTNGFSNHGLIANPAYANLVSVPEGFAVGQPPLIATHSLQDANHRVVSPEPAQRGSCCSAKAPPTLSHQGSISSMPSPAVSVANGLPQQQYPFSNGGFGIGQQIYTPYQHQTTTYSYPSSYGSFSQPLQPQQWRASAQSNMYAQQPPQSAISNGMTAFDTPPNSSIANLETLHSCSCGDTCQCIGCAAHPYNDATQEYVRSAWKLAHEPATPVASGFLLKNNGFASMDGEASPISHMNGSNGIGDGMSSPTGNTPSDSGTAEEQVLPETDFFFVEYPFLDDGCGGDTHTCPCGDGCQCLGCTIHSFNTNSAATTTAEGGDSSATTNSSMGGNTLNGSNGFLKLEPGASPLLAPKRSCCG